MWRLTELSASLLLQPGLPRRPLMAVSIHVLVGGFVRSSNPALGWVRGGGSWFHLPHEYNGPLIFDPQLSPHRCFCLLRSPWSLFSSSRFFSEVSLNPHIHCSSIWAPMSAQLGVSAVLVCIRSSGTRTVSKLSLTPVALHRPDT